MKTLSICIPTFKREESIRKIALNFAKNNSNKLISLIILNDCPESIIENLNNEKKQIFYFQNKTNLGYAKSFIKLLELSKSDYVLMSSDDDEINYDELKLLFNYLQKNDSEFISTIYKIKNKVYRGKEGDNEIFQSRIRAASNHAPGLIYKTDFLKSKIDKLSSRIDKRCYMSIMYPQVIMAYLIKFDGGKLFWNSTNPVSEGENLISNLSYDDGKTYTHPENRIREFKSLDEFFIEGFLRKEFNRNIYYNLRIKHKISLIKFILLPLIRSQSNDSVFTIKEKISFLISNTSLIWRNYFQVFFLIISMIKSKILSNYKGYNK